MHAYPRMSKKLVCKYTATTRMAMPLIMSVAIGSASRELHKHNSNEIHDFHHKYVMVRVNLKFCLTHDHYGSRDLWIT